MLTSPNDRVLRFNPSVNFRDEDAFIKLKPFFFGTFWFGFCFFNNANTHLCGDFTDVSATTESLFEKSMHFRTPWRGTSIDVLADVSASLPRMIFLLLLQNMIFAGSKYHEKKNVFMRKFLDHCMALKRKRSASRNLGQVMSEFGLTCLPYHALVL